MAARTISTSSHKHWEIVKDRTDFFPPHTGPNVLPNNPFFTRLLRHARRGRICLRDIDLDVTKTYGEILVEVLALRKAMENTLPSSILDQLSRGEEIFMGVLASGGHEFTIAMLAVLAIGAAAVPMSASSISINHVETTSERSYSLAPANPVEEAAYFVTKSKQVLVLSSTKASDLARNVVAHVGDRGREVQHLDIGTTLPTAPPSAFGSDNIVISSNRYLDDNAAGVVIFTSGTTGRPKGSTLRRAYIHETASAVADGYEIGPDDVLLHVLPVHHATGLGTSFFPFLNSGATIEFRTGSFSPPWIWDRLRKRGITILSGVPTMLMRLMWHYQREIASLPPAQRRSFDEGASVLKSVVCGSGALQQPVQDFWTELRQGRPILVRYGSSEVPACIRVSANADFSKLPKGCVGSAVPGVDVKISDEGELLIKSPYMFSKYLFDDEATVAAHDEDGWFKTGDICERHGEFYTIVGRASVDIIKSGGYKIGAVDIERACLELSYIKEVMVVGVADDEYGQRVAAAITLKDGNDNLQISCSIEELRTQLRRSLPGYKLPTLLRVVSGELPKGPTGKVQKKILGPELFPPSDWQHDADVQAWTKTKTTNNAKL